MKIRFEWIFQTFPAGLSPSAILPCTVFSPLWCHCEEIRKSHITSSPYLWNADNFHTWCGSPVLGNSLFKSRESNAVSLYNTILVTKPRRSFHHIFGSFKRGDRRIGKGLCVLVDRHNLHIAINIDNIE